MIDSDFDSVIAALTGNAVTPARIDAACRHLTMLRALHDEVRDRRASFVPRGADGWRSTAADRYVERLHELRTTLEAVLESLASAVSQLAERISGLRCVLEAREAEVRAEAERSEALRESLARADDARAERGTAGLAGSAGSAGSSGAVDAAGATAGGATAGGATAWTTH